jgi:ubiquinone/menaquinone biosynthesis C-methylase UbiE
MTAANANDEQIEYWNSEAGQRWAGMQARIDTMFAPMTEVALERAKLAPGEKVLDVGCGSGATSLEAARYVGPEGQVLGVDVSQPMLKLAVRRGFHGNLAQLSFFENDAAEMKFEPTFDVLISRFGWMFFADPVAAFTNLRTALVPGGRLMFMCWQRLSKNPWFLTPVLAMREVVPADPNEPKPDPLAPGPFAFADAERIRATFTEAGFTDIEVEPVATTMKLGGPGDVESALDFATKIGPGSRLLADAPEDKRPAMIESVRRALAAKDSPQGIVLDAAIWVVTARTKPA